MSIPKSLRIFLLSAIILMSSDFGLLACEGSCLAGLSSPKGLIIVGSVYAITSGISNFLWAFRWSKHTDVSDETSATIQEWGGITAAIENWILGFMIPLMGYMYLTHPPAAQINDPQT